MTDRLNLTEVLPPPSPGRASCDFRMSGLDPVSAWDGSSNHRRARARATTRTRGNGETI